MCDLFINVIFELIAHFQQLSAEMIGNENIENKQRKEVCILIVLISKNFLRIW